MAKFKKGDIIEDAHGNDYEVLLVESSTGRIVIRDINNPGLPERNEHEKWFEKA